MGSSGRMGNTTMGNRSESGRGGVPTAVVSAHRAKGAGRTLLRALIEIARRDGHRGLSPSGSPSNCARPLQGTMNSGSPRRNK
jgi:predicted N-acetyltransferase YhbS